MSKRLTKEEFIQRAIKIHGSKYDFSNIEYINNTTKIIVFDNELKEFFLITPASILCGCGNKKNVGKKLSKKFAMGKSNFINKAVNVHGNKFDYSKVEYINNRTKIEIICPIHGAFFQTPDKHLNGQGCPKCCKRNRRYTSEEFIERAREIHGDRYDYSRTVYKKNLEEKVEVICKKHGPFLISPSNHLRGCGCKYCTVGDVFNTNDFKIKAQAIHKNKYSYDKAEFNGAFNKVTIICPIHGEFQQSPHKHVMGQGCPKCGKLFRKKENDLFNELSKAFPNDNIIHSYYDFKTLGKQELDIFFPEYKIAVEFQGEQHFIPIDFGGKGYKWSLDLLEYNKERDINKKNICESNGITLLYFSNVKEKTFLGEHLYHEYNEIILKIKKIIKNKTQIPVNII